MANDVGQKALQGRTVEGGPRQAAVVIMIWDQAPTLMGLALDVGLAGIERVEREVEVMLGRFAGVDGAAEDLSLGGLHGCAPSDDRELRRRGPSGPAAWPSTAPPD
jgi:hypothetical protein